MRNFCSDKEHRRSILTRRHTCAATDTLRGIHRYISRFFCYRDSIAIRCATSGNGNETAGLNDAVKCAAVNHKVFDYREWASAPRLDSNRITILEKSNVQLTSCGCLQWSVRDAVNHQ